MPTDYYEVEARIRSAVDAYDDTPNPNITRIAREFNVPRSRLNSRIRGRASRDERLAPRRKLNVTQEIELLEYLNTLDMDAVVSMKQTVEARANSILREAHTDLNTPPPTVSGNWYGRWIVRHPQYRRLRRRVMRGVASQGGSPSESRATRARGAATAAEAEEPERDDTPTPYFESVEEMIDILVRGSKEQAEDAKRLRQQFEDIVEPIFRLDDLSKACRRRMLCEGAVTISDPAEFSWAELSYEDIKARNRLRGEWRVVMEELVERAIDRGQVVGVL